MERMEQVHYFAIKWLKKFKSKDTNYIELVDHFMADDCDSLGFIMDCGRAFSEKYGKAVNDNDALKKIIHEVKDIDLLGSAIYSQWRYFNHWAYDASEILFPENRAWFITALINLAYLSETGQVTFKGKLKKIRIDTSNILYHLPPNQKREVEQHLTINSQGRVWFSRYAIDKD